MRTIRASVTGLSILASISRDRLLAPAAVGAALAAAAWVCTPVMSFG